MKFTITTAVLQDMMSKATKGASCDGQRPLTGLIAIELKENVLTLITSSATNYLYVSRPNITGDDFYIVVPVEIFAKLVSKLTAENTTLELKDDNLIVKSGGTYTIAASINEEGELTKYPNPLNSDEFNTPKNSKNYDIKKTTFNLMLAVNSASVAEGEVAKTVPEIYTGYYLSKSIVTTNSINMCGVDIPVSDDVLLLRPETVKLTEVFTAENLGIGVNDDGRGGKNVLIMAKDEIDCMIVSKLMENAEDYQIDAINELLSSEYESKCSISKQNMLQALDRLMLFIDKLDDFVLYMTFTNDGLKLSNKKSSSEEVLNYEASDNFKPFTCRINVKMLFDQIKAVPGDLVNMLYGLKQCIKFEDGNITQLIALITD